MLDAFYLFTTSTYGTARWYDVDDGHGPSRGATYLFLSQLPTLSRALRKGQSRLTTAARKPSSMSISIPAFVDSTPVYITHAGNIKDEAMSVNLGIAH